MTSPRGCFLVLEGVDGAGTTTQAGLLSCALRARGFPVLATRQPSEGPVGTLIRQALTGRLALPGGAGPLTSRTLALLFAADREDSLTATVLPALESGQVVVCDRYVFSFLAYQGLDLPLEWVTALNRHAPPAHATFYLRVPPEVAEARRAYRGAAPEHFESAEVQRRLAASYEAAFQARGEGRHVVRVDGTDTREAVHAVLLRESLRILEAAGLRAGRRLVKRRRARTSSAAPLGVAQSRSFAASGQTGQATITREGGGVKGQPSHCRALTCATQSISTVVNGHE